MNKNLEPELKALIVNHLKTQDVIDDNDLLINEFNIGDFSRRVDLALVKVDRILAYEIKSDGDTLLRLEGQVAKYLEYFDKVTVITTPKHSSKAYELIPRNVALWEVSSTGLRVIQKGKRILISDKLRLIELMTMADLKRVAKENKIAISTKRTDLESRVLLLPLNKIRTYAIQALTRRFSKVNILSKESIDGSIFKKSSLKKNQEKKRISLQLDNVIADLYQLESELLNQSTHSSSVDNSDVSSK